MERCALCVRIKVSLLFLTQAARKAVSGVGDGRISKKDAESLLVTILDGNSITKIEYRTAWLLLRDFKFTDEV